MKLFKHSLKNISTEKAGPLGITRALQGDG